MKQYFGGLSPTEEYSDHVGVSALEKMREPYKLLNTREDLETVIGNYLPKARTVAAAAEKSDGLFVIK